MPELIELYKEHKRLWKEYIERPDEEHRAIYNNNEDGLDLTEIDRIAAELKAVNEAINAHPDERDFVEDMTKALGPWICESADNASAMWSAMANVDWTHEKGTEFSASFRAAGGIIADIRNKANGIDIDAHGLGALDLPKEAGEIYMTWYCSGPYATVSDHIAEKMAELGWTHDSIPDHL